MTDYLEEKLLKDLFGVAAYTPPATIYVALFTADPTESGSLTNEVSGGSYTREALSVDWNSGANRIDSDALIRFDALPACTVTHVALMDASTAGNMLWSGALSSSLVVPAGFPVEIPAASLTVTLD